MQVTQLEWIVTIAVTIAVLLFDVVVIGRRPHEPSKRELVTALSVYIGLAVAFGIWVYFFHGSQFGVEFFAGWLTEYSLSVDNLFIFLIIMASFNVPKKYQQQALLVGIILALIFRAIFIALGAVAINEFSWVFYIFGAFLLYTAITLAKDTDHDDDADNFVVRFARSHLQLTDKWDGLKLWVKENGKRLMTPMFLVIVALGTTDLIFALDSIPAIYGLTQEPYLVFTANVFALMGLRQLYFLLGDLLKRLVYLSQGLAIILAFIGVKLILHALHENELPFINGGEHVPVPEIPTLLSLGVIIVVLVITTVASLYKTRVKDKKDPEIAQDTTERPTKPTRRTRSSNERPARRRGVDGAVRPPAGERPRPRRARRFDRHHARCRRAGGAHRYRQVLLGGRRPARGHRRRRRVHRPLPDGVVGRVPRGLRPPGARGRRDQRTRDRGWLRIRDGRRHPVDVGGHHRADRTRRRCDVPDVGARDLSVRDGAVGDARDASGPDHRRVHRGRIRVGRRGGHRARSWCRGRSRWPVNCRSSRPRRTR